jgi:hypothetical protein
MSEELGGSNSEESGVLSTVGEVIGNLATGIPAPIRKNLITALGRLLTAAVDYPVACVEGAIAEKRAESDARVAMIKTSGSQFAVQMKISPEYALAATRKFSQKIIRERVNVDRIAAIATTELKSEPPTAVNENEPGVPPISEDWLNAFENEAAQMSSEQMQRLFGKILAGEIRRPTSYSIKTLRLMSQLDNQAANLFRLLCSLSISTRIPKSNIVLDARVVSMGNAGENSLLSYGLGFVALNTLQEYGLIISEYNSAIDHKTVVLHENEILGLPITYQNKQWIFAPKDAPTVLQNFKVSGVGFSQSGKELLSVVDIDPNKLYTEALKNFLDQQGMMMRAWYR